MEGVRFGSSDSLNLEGQIVKAAIASQRARYDLGVKVVGRESQLRSRPW